MIVNQFYTAFSEGDVEIMVGCYSNDTHFCDPVFGDLYGTEAKNMWRMLIARSKGGLKIDYKILAVKDDKVSVKWVAEYVFSQTARKVVNHITAEIVLRDGKIIQHTDTFDLWKWSSQALGLKGYLLGWTGLVQNKIRQNAQGSLKKYSTTIK